MRLTKRPSSRNDSSAATAMLTTPTSAVDTSVSKTGMSVTGTWKSAAGAKPRACGRRADADRRQATPCALKNASIFAQPSSASVLL